MTEARMLQKMLPGNDVIARGLVEQGCRVVTAYPGTPSSEILAGVI
jgi:indolepyruvate ferredoxin oxidoreductase alpha subunit